MMPDKYYIGAQDYSLEDTSSKEAAKNSEKLSIRLKNLLQLKNVNFLFGNGASLPLGSPSISDANKFLKLDAVIKWHGEIDDSNKKEAFDKLATLINGFSGEDGTKIDVETLLSILIQTLAVTEQNSIFKCENSAIVFNSATRDDLELWVKLLKEMLCLTCNAFIDTLDIVKIQPHKQFLQKILLRPANLSRVKLFTLNYDMLLEKCMDELGISYFDGFIGGYERRFSPESYQYDLYYPGDVTEGRVNRVDRVLQLYKLHGSIHWQKEKEGSTNLHGIKQNAQSPIDYNDVLIYPSTMKYGETLGFPYSEMFRHFSTSIFRPQTVLFTVGYAFNDEHINRLIFQALSVPTFHLVIALPEGTENKVIGKFVNEVKSNRIIIISGMKDGELGSSISDGAGTFKQFVEKYLPDMEEMSIQEKINKDIQALYKVDPVTSDSNANGDSVVTELMNTHESDNEAENDLPF